MTRTTNQCDYVIRAAGKNWDDSPAALAGYGDTTLLCRQPGRSVPHTFWVKRPGITNGSDPVKGTVIRCREHRNA